jgi:hypothetical protein
VEIRLMNAPLFANLAEAQGTPKRLSLEPVMPEEPVLPLSVEMYHALVASGHLQSGDPIELLEGFLALKMGRGPRHELVRRRLFRRLMALVPAGFFVDSQGAATLIDSEPEPDVFIIRGTEEDYADRHAGPADAVVVIEVSDSSVHRDRNWKKRIYARSGVACYWVVNVVDDYVEVFTEPSGNVKKPTYGKPAVYNLGDAVPLLIDGKEIAQLLVAEILGRAPSES